MESNNLPELKEIVLRIGSLFSDLYMVLKSIDRNSVESAELLSRIEYYTSIAWGSMVTMGNTISDGAMYQSESIPWYMSKLSNFSRKFERGIDYKSIYEDRLKNILDGLGVEYQNLLDLKNKIALE